MCVPSLYWFRLGSLYGFINWKVNSCALPQSRTRVWTERNTASWVVLSASSYCQLVERFRENVWEERWLVTKWPKDRDADKNRVSLFERLDFLYHSGHLQERYSLLPDYSRPAFVLVNQNSHSTIYEKMFLWLGILKHNGLKIMLFLRRSERLIQGINWGGEPDRLPLPLLG